MPATHDPAVVAEPPPSTSAPRPEKVRVVTRRCQPEEEPQGRHAPGLVRVGQATAGATGDAPPAGIAYAPPAWLTVMGLIRLYWEHVGVYYRRLRRAPPAAAAAPLSADERKRLDALMSGEAR